MGCRRKARLRPIGRQRPSIAVRDVLAQRDDVFFDGNLALIPNGQGGVEPAMSADHPSRPINRRARLAVLSVSLFS
jgi:hypothetical protein